MKSNQKNVEAASRPELVEGRDYYFENGLMVLTAHFLRERGYCCSNNCRHCPYPKNENIKLKQIIS